MLRLLAPGQAPPPVIGALVRRARALQDHVREESDLAGRRIDGQRGAARAGGRADPLRQQRGEVGGVHAGGLRRPFAQFA